MLHLSVDVSSTVACFALETTMHRPSTTSCLASLVAAVLLAGAGGCSGENIVIANGGTGGGAAGAGGQGGAAGVGGTVEGCIGIRVEPSVLPPDYDWGPIMDSPTKQPFWRDANGIHLLWRQGAIPPGGGDWQAYLVAASFDPEMAAPFRVQVYEAFPRDVPVGGTRLDSTAGAPDGSFAAAIGWADDEDPYGTVDRVALGNVNQPELTTVWAPPWSRAEAALIHVGFDGQAFAVHAVAQTGSQVRLVRLAPDGTVLTPETEVGTITRLDDDGSAFHTDPETGTTWMATSHDDGVWLSGHYRDGTLLPGTESRGGVDIKGQGLAPNPYGSWCPAVATDGDQALLAWLYKYGGAHLEDQTCLQRVLGSTPAADAFVITDETWEYVPGRKVMARLGELWRLVQHDANVGIESYELSDTEVLWRGVLVPYDPCDLPCPEDRPRYLDARSLGVATWQDEVWFGYRDSSQPYPPSPSPYYLLRVKRGCSYPVHLY